jgi:HB1, ASXL, restriction endonuclease HTH domain
MEYSKEGDMFLSEAEAEARLDDLRRQRADLGRRLARPGQSAAASDPAPGQPAAPPHRDTVPAPQAWAEPPRTPSAPRSAPDSRAEPARPEVAPPEPAVPAGAAARREGRRLIETAEEILAAAGRPMHAAEIWEQLAARGLTLPGHDPVAALNTRLWKRAQGGAVFRRLGDAVYGLAS